jgi:hypothetical protein
MRDDFEGFIEQTGIFIDTKCGIDRDSFVSGETTI